jgi:predicted nucleic-acid-binding Zn-ribbon protein
MIHIVTKTSKLPGPVLQMDCPSCGANAVAAKTADVTAREYLYGLIPVTTSRWVSITCGACNRAFRSPFSCSELATLTPQELSAVVAVKGMAYVGFITKFCIILSLVLGIMPICGLLCALIGVIGARNSRSRWRTAAFIGLGISIISTGLCLWLVIAAKPS